MDKVAVTQADRSAAARIRSIYTRRVDGQSRAEGNVAAHAAAAEMAAQEAARYRIATAEACARIAEKWREENKAAAAKARKESRARGDNGLADMLDGAAIECNAIATAIRLQQGSEKP